VARRIRVHQITGVTGAVGLVCDTVAGGEPPPTDAVLVDRAALIELLPTIGSAIETFVFLRSVDAASLDTGAMARISLLVDQLRNAPDHVAAIRRVRAVNATKRVHDGVVVGAVDRETLNLLRPPEVVSRRALETALERLGPSHDAVVNPTVLAASDGGKVLVVEDDHLDLASAVAPSPMGSSRYR